MPPKKQAADSSPPQPTSNRDPAEEDPPGEKKPGAVALRKLSAHPTTPIMVREALKALDSRKGVSSQAIQSFIKQKYPYVDAVRLKHLVRRALIRGVETGTLVRPVNSSVTTGATGRFRLPPKGKEPKPKSENADPNEQKAPRAAKDDVNPPEKGGATKRKASAKGKIKSTENLKTAKKAKGDEEAAPSKVALPKKPKAKKADVKVSSEENSNSTKTEATKIPKVSKLGKAVQSKAAKAGGDAPVPKTTGRRGKKTE